MPAARTEANTAARDARRLSTLLEISQALSGTLNLKTGMQRVLQTLIRHHSVVRGMVVLQQAGAKKIGFLTDPKAARALEELERRR